MRIKQVSIALFCFLAACVCAAQTVSSSQQSTTAPPTTNVQQQFERLEKTIHDYGNLARYREDDVKLSPPSTGENRVVFMGDSITDYWGRRGGAFFPGKPYVNRGISGQVTPQMLIRFHQDVIDLKPSVVVILAGTNDIGGSLGPIPNNATKNNLISMVELARVNNIRVVLSSLTPVCDSLQPQTAKRPPEKILALNEWIKNYAAEHNLVYLDYYPHMIDDKGLLRSNLTVDCLHPNQAGYDIMAPLAEQAIAKALQQ
ncbi:MAG TPA: GDSL-type esterase/lipase family protein [Bryobacteraceae bacterium]|nr:GDSL-type esterase/lipase family protein [Bryobacteraceae bacterium]